MDQRIVDSITIWWMIYIMHLYSETNTAGSSYPWVPHLWIQQTADKMYKEIKKIYICTEHT